MIKLYSPVAGIKIFNNFEIQSTFILIKWNSGRHIYINNSQTILQPNQKQLIKS